MANINLFRKIVLIPLLFGHYNFRKKLFFPINNLLSFFIQNRGSSWFWRKVSSLFYRLKSLARFFVFVPRRPRRIKTYFAQSLVILYEDQNWKRNNVSYKLPKNNLKKITINCLCQFETKINLQWSYNILLIQLENLHISSLLVFKKISFPNFVIFSCISCCFFGSWETFSRRYITYQLLILYFWYSSWNFQPKQAESI